MVNTCVFLLYHYPLQLTYLFLCIISIHEPTWNCSSTIFYSFVFQPYDTAADSDAGSLILVFETCNVTKLVEATVVAAVVIIGYRVDDWNWEAISRWPQPEVVKKVKCHWFWHWTRDSNVKRGMTCWKSSTHIII